MERLKNNYNAFLLVFAESISVENPAKDIFGYLAVITIIFGALLVWTNGFDFQGKIIGYFDAEMFFWNTVHIINAIEGKDNLLFTNYLNFPYGFSMLRLPAGFFEGFIAFLFYKLFSFSHVDSFNASVLSTFFFTGIIGYWIAKDILKKTWPSVFSALFFALGSYVFQKALIHVYLANLGFPALALYLFIKNWDSGKNAKEKCKAMLLPGALLGFLFYVAMPYFFMALEIIIAYVLAKALIAKKLNFETALQFGTYFIVAGIIAMPFILQMAFTYGSLTFVTPEPEQDMLYSVDATSYLMHLPWLTEKSPESYTIFGIIFFLIAILGAVYAIKEKNSIANDLILMLVLAIVLSLGYFMKIFNISFGLSPYLFFDILYPFDQFRTPGRFSAFAIFFASMLAGFLFLEIFKKYKKGIALAACALLLAGYLAEIMPEFKSSDVSIDSYFADEKNIEGKSFAVYPITDIWFSDCSTKAYLVSAVSNRPVLNFYPTRYLHSDVFMLDLITLLGTEGENEKYVATRAFLEYRKIDEIILIKHDACKNYLDLRNSSMERLEERLNENFKIKYESENISVYSAG